MATKDANLATIAPLSARPSKEDEIRFIRAVCESIPADSYLSSMFVGAAEYVERIIRDDFALAPYVETIEEAHRGRTAAAALVRENEKLDATIKDLETTIAADDDEIAKLRAARETDQEWIAHLLALQEVLQLEAHKRALADDLERTEKGIALARETLAANPQPVAEA